jgi:O-acetyl-ADP-ribose deacetylase (regulator of RNase III)
MKCKHIIHVHSPSWNPSDQVTKINELTQVVKNILTLAEKNTLRSIALPSISSGGYFI